MFRGTPQARRLMPRHQRIFLAVLVGLAVLSAVIWFLDPAHRQAGPSRIDWRGAAPAKP